MTPSPHPSLTLRHASMSDAPAVARVFNDSWPVSASGHSGRVIREFLSAVSPDFWESQIRNPSNRVTVAQSPHPTPSKDSAVLGFSLLRPSNEPEVIELDRLFVCPNAARSGVGSALLADAVLYAQKEGRDAAELWVLENNLVAKRLYENSGWSYTGRVKSRGALTWDHMFLVLSDRTAP